ncbi:hypothetical protein WA158_003785 [Blastocystis sp. Blastoise]
MDVENEPQIRVKFVTKFDKYRVPETPIAVPLRFSRYGLSEVVNHLLDLATPQPFDFLINGKFLRIVLSQFLAENDLSSENVLSLEYIPIISKPEEKSSDSFPDWISSISVRDNYYTVGSYDGSLTLFNNNDEQLSKVRLHKLPIKSIASCVINNTLVGITGSIDNRIKIVKAELNAEKPSFSVVNTLVGHNASLSTVSISPNKKFFASGAWNGSLNVWNIETQLNGTDKEKENPLNTFTGHNENISCISWIDNKSFLSSCWDHTIRSWDMETEGVINTYLTNKVVTCVRYNPLNSLFISGHPDGIIRLFDSRASNGTIMKMAFSQSGSWTTSLAWKPDSEYIFVSGSQDHKIRLWDIRSSYPTYILDTIHTDKIFDVQWKDNNTILSGGADKELKRSVIA